MAAGLGFVGLIAVTAVLVRRFAAAGEARWAAASRLTGAFFRIGFAGLASGSSHALVVLGFWGAWG